MKAVGSDGLREKPREAGRFVVVVVGVLLLLPQDDEVLIWRERRGRLATPPPTWAGMLGGRAAMTDMAVDDVSVVVDDE